MLPACMQVARCSVCVPVGEAFRCRATPLDASTSTNAVAYDHLPTAEELTIEVGAGLRRFTSCMQDFRVPAERNRGF
jgi:hypothetical protein